MPRLAATRFSLKLKCETPLNLCFKVTWHEAVLQQTERISGEGFPRFSGTGSGSFGRLRSFLVVTGLTVMVSEYKHIWWCKLHIKNLKLIFLSQDIITINTTINHQVDDGIALLVGHRTCHSQVTSSSPGWAPLHSGLEQATYTCVPLSLLLKLIQSIVNNPL